MSHSLKQKTKILFQLSGSIAAFKACEAISTLVKDGFEVKCVASESALKFVGSATLEGLTGHPVFTDAYETGRKMDHIHLIRWADIVLLCPATATTINKLSSGIGDNAISMLFLAHQFDKPYLIAPAMNHAMLEHPSTQESLRKLKEWDLTVIEPESGSLACGESGAGRLASPHKILTAVYQALSYHDKKLKVLVTLGGTEEPIDQVRTLSNFSTGQTGSVICDFLSKQGVEITAVTNKKSIQPAYSSRLLHYQSFLDLDHLLKKELNQNSYDAIIHLAAVSDFSVSHLNVNGKKLTSSDEKISSKDEVSIHLQQNHKIVQKLNDYSANKDIQIISFKLTRTDHKEKQLEQVQSLIESSHTDYVVHNELSEITNSSHPFTIYDRLLTKTSGNGKEGLATSIYKLISSASKKKFIANTRSQTMEATL